MFVKVTIDAFRCPTCFRESCEISAVATVEFLRVDVDTMNLGSDEVGGILADFGIRYASAERDGPIVLDGYLYGEWSMRKRRAIRRVPPLHASTTQHRQPMDAARAGVPGAGFHCLCPTGGVHLDAMTSVRGTEGL
jgi:hypothetical protein